ncbi:MAG TPA: sigma factor [Albitalea sp.]
MPTSPSRAWPARSRELSQPLARTGLGERAAFAALYAKSSPHLYAVVLRLCRDRALAEAVLQEVYVHVWRAAPSFDAAHGDPLAWLTGLARQRAIVRLRRDGPSPAEAVEPPDAPACRLDGLDAAERAAFAAAFYDGAVAAEAARRLGAPPGVVRRAVRRALQWLRHGGVRPRVPA